MSRVRETKKPQPVNAGRGSVVCSRGIDPDALHASLAARVAVMVSVMAVRAQSDHGRESRRSSVTPSSLSPQHRAWPQGNEQPRSRPRNGAAMGGPQ